MMKENFQTGGRLHIDSEGRRVAGRKNDCGECLHLVHHLEGIGVEEDGPDYQVLNLNHVVYLCHALYSLGGS